MQAGVDNPRVYGRGPFRIAVIHGGPGGPGYMAPVARELAADGGILEPLQTADSVDGQVRELAEVLMTHADPPVTLVGSSWGAMLSLLAAARHPELVRKVVLIGSGVYEEADAAAIVETRLARLSREERREVQILTAVLNDPTVRNKNEPFARLGTIMVRADSYDPLTLDTETIESQYDRHVRVWREVQAMRADGRLLDRVRSVRCPAAAIHGDYDPHPAEAVRQSLSAVLPEFRFHLLEKCGHYPWLERQARERFYRILRRELA